MSKIAALDVLPTGVNTVDVLVQLSEHYSPGPPWDSPTPQTACGLSEKQEAKEKECQA